ncbi:exodeoxyribonuclease VII large subunit [Belliella kenyensis]|uniref:Exodeoxyribonuclease 7 large subunit n=1 Tax=Belliella kenyensis TaxID=1472724 RepID=A0ABV8EMQ2_9BACT|nr:exodeoxyribonuclease VII large subunit [Belliella kenyensis]MCH7400488.1 exodeoxyribonuclease VII large subunit [Belliella kenyensis]MDN3604496.1 exodeoxyribonuclease VII large subunit [Belliella kenyensis]
MQQPLTLLELNNLIKSTLENHLEAQYWVVAEIGEMKVAAQGHAYLELVEKSNNQVKAKIRANIWQYTFRTVAGNFERITGTQIKAGMKILVSVTVTFHELYGISLQVKDVDPNFTLGERARIRQEIIVRLTQEGLMQTNKRFALPIVPQKIAVISSGTAAGYGDFINQLDENRYAYQIDYQLFPASMQGEAAAKSIIDALKQISESKSEYDLVVIIRGGGAQMDLDCFDDYELAVMIAKYPLPVLTGIGHERDETIADLVAHTKVKTPTAAAEFIISGFMNFEDRLLTLLKNIEKQTIQALKWEDRNLLDFENSIKRLAAIRLQSQSTFLMNKETQLKTNVLNKLRLENHELDKNLKLLEKVSKNKLQSELKLLEALSKNIINLDPNSIFAKGYTKSEVNGLPLHQVNVTKGEVLTTFTSNKKIESIINKIEDYGK